MTGCSLCSLQPVGAPHHSATHNSSLCEAFAGRFPRAATVGVQVAKKEDFLSSSFFFKQKTFR